MPPPRNALLRGPGSSAQVTGISYFMPPLSAFRDVPRPCSDCTQWPRWRRPVLGHLAVVSLSPRYPDLCLTTYTISQDDLKSNHVIQLEEPHYFESPAEVRLCLRSHYMTFLLP